MIEIAVWTNGDRQNQVVTMGFGFAEDTGRGGIALNWADV